MEFSKKNGCQFDIELIVKCLIECAVLDKWDCVNLIVNDLTNAQHCQILDVDPKILTTYLYKHDVENLQKITRLFQFIETIC